MKKEEAATRLEKIAKDNEILENLYLDSNFQYWKKNTIDTRLDFYLKAILESENNEDGDKKALRYLRRYQDLKLIGDECFTLASKTGSWAREQLKKLKDIFKK